MTRRLTTLDLPSFHRASIGFDRLFDEMDRLFMNSAQSTSYPPYNIVSRTENEYEVQLAVAGFSEEQLDVVYEQGVLRIEGTSGKVEEGVTYLHKGVGARNFKREFRLADHVEVTNAGLKNGMLTVTLRRIVPEELQPKKIKITSAPVSGSLI